MLRPQHDRQGAIPWGHRSPVEHTRSRPAPLHRATPGPQMPHTRAAGAPPPGTTTPGGRANPAPARDRTTPGRAGAGHPPHECLNAHRAIRSNARSDRDAPSPAAATRSSVRINVTQAPYGSGREPPEPSLSPPTEPSAASTPRPGTRAGAANTPVDTRSRPLARCGAGSGIPNGSARATNSS